MNEYMNVDRVEVVDGLMLFRGGSLFTGGNIRRMQVLNRLSAMGYGLIVSHNSKVAEGYKFILFDMLTTEDVVRFYGEDELRYFLPLYVPNVWSE